jgi:hypothetical protein
MVHMAINVANTTDGGTDWLEPVTAEQYAADQSTGRAFVVPHVPEESTHRPSHRLLTPGITKRTRFS